MSAVNRLHVALLMATTTAFAINCDVTFPPTTFQAMLYDTQQFPISQNQAWLVSPNALTTMTPSGSTRCSSPAYFAQYAVNGAPSLCVTTSSSVTQTATGCVWNLFEAADDVTTFYATSLTFNINCDPNANAAIVPPTYLYSQFTPQQSTGSTYWGNFTSNLVCGDAPLFRIAKKP